MTLTTLMTPLLADGPLLWFLNRSSGLTLLVLLSLSVALGVLTLGGRAGGEGGARVPRFVTQSLHRNLALGSLVLLAAHVGTAVADEYVDIRWWHAVVPWGADFRPVWLALGTLSFDLMVAVVVTTALRRRIPHRTWRTVHLGSWAAWALGVLHGVMIGTDLRAADGWRWWSVAPTLLAVGVVAIAASYRLLARPGPTGTAGTVDPGHPPSVTGPAPTRLARSVSR